MNCLLQAGTRVLGVALILLLAACGGGGGGAGGSPAPETPPAAAPSFGATYVPLATGDRRSWKTLPGSSSGVGLDISERVEGAVRVGGIDGFELRDENGNTEVVAVTATGVFSLPREQDDALSRALGPIELLRFGLTAGQTVTTLDRTVRVDLDGDRRDEDVALRVRFTVVGFDAVDTTLARFTQAARVRTEVRTQSKLSSGRALDVTVTAEAWYVAGIGAVRTVTTTQAVGQAPQEDTEEITAYGVGSLRSEQVAPQLRDMSPAEGSATSDTRANVRLNFSEPLDRFALNGAESVALIGPSGTAVQSVLDVQDGGRTVMILAVGPLAEGRYTVRLGKGLIDLANNAVAPKELHFDVDTTLPRLVSSEPADGATDAALTGTVSMRFSEDVQPAPGETLAFEVIPLLGLDRSSEQRLPVTVNGPVLSAVLTTPLARDLRYELRLVGRVADRAGNVITARTTSVYFTTQPGVLARSQPLVAGSSVYAVRHTDVDGDGRKDLAFVAYDGTDSYIGMRPGLAAGGFGPAVRLQRIYAGECRTQHLVAGDFDGDGRTDLALACGYLVYVALQSSPGQFVLEPPRWNLPLIFAADMNGDNRTELLGIGTAPGLDYGANPWNWQALNRIGTGAWSSLVTYSLGWNYATLATVADLDGNGRGDLVWVKPRENGGFDLAWRLQADNSYGALNLMSATDAPDRVQAMAVRDVDGDGLVDVTLLMARDGASPWLAVAWGRAGGGFDAPRQVASLPASAFSFAYDYTLALADVNADGRLDVLVAGNQVGVLLQTAPRTFDAVRAFNLSNTGYRQPFAESSLLWVDVNGDGRPDLIVQGDLLLSLPNAGGWQGGLASANANANANANAAPARARWAGLVPGASAASKAARAASAPR